MKSGRPKGFSINPDQTWLLVNRPQTYTAGLYPEPDQFTPERFIGRTYSPFEFLPFGGDHRRCLGSGLSDFEMRIALAEIVTHWEFEPSEVEREIRHDIAMGPKNGVRLRIKSRRD